MTQLRWIDFLVVVSYLVGMTLVGLRFSRRQTSTDKYFVAGRAIPAWAMGLSLLATVISSVTFVAYPGSAYAGDWSQLVPGFMAIAVVLGVGAVVIPFLRHAVGMSTYEYFEARFGRPTRIYASFTFLLAHFAKMAFVFYLMALTINSITGWPVSAVVLVSAAVMIFYTLVGGIEAVIWTDVIQAFVCWVGVAVALYYLLFTPQGGPAAVFHLAATNHKFSLGSTQLVFARPTILVLTLYGLFWYLQRYTADQTIVQRYLVAKSDTAAMKGAALGAFLAVPVWTVFMLLGTCTWAFFKITRDPLPAYITKTDQIFPYFIASHLPPGLSGLFLASLLGAAMTMLASDLNSIAVLGVEDYYRLLKPKATDAMRLRVGRILVIVVGVISAAAGLILAHSTGSALTLYYAVTAIFSSSLAGLFILAFVSRRTNTQGIYLGIAASTLCTVWAFLTKGAKPLLNLGPFNFRWDDLMVGAVGNVVLIVVGYLASLIFMTASRQGISDNVLTLWDWLIHRRQNEETPQAVSTKSQADPIPLSIPKR